MESINSIWVEAELIWLEGTCRIELKLLRTYVKLGSGRFLRMGSMLDNVVFSLACGVGPRIA